ncbi:MAG: GGDEF domain-containing protein [Dictyoglomus sp.]|nr:GGDEF domain-containing protein [Dictyoglomus sp.]MCX7941717.1 GGDEF domain-containing protein [Dictyoglomaceae bacterium]MDW8189061.1 diguanylate cyclase [Dictyoglomus sp.]
MKINQLYFLFLSIILCVFLFIKTLWASLGGVALLIIMNLLYSKQSREKISKSLSENLIYDPITGLVNSVYFRHHLTEDFLKAKRMNKSLSILIFDIDHFKDINKNLGYRFGDLLLKEVANIVNSCIRTSDVFSYFGADDFGIILNDTDQKRGKMIGERIINKLTSSPIVISINNKEEKIHFTISMGGCSLSSDMETPLDLLDRARKNLEKAKNQGGNAFIFE